MVVLRHQQTSVTCVSKTGIMSTALFLRKMKVKKFLRKIKIKKIGEIVETIFKSCKPIFSKQWA
jgi:hypothetical protein